MEQRENLMIHARNLGEMFRHVDKTIAVQTYENGACACGTILSRYNPTNKCASCEQKEKNSDV